MSKIVINPFKGLTTIQTEKDLDLIRIQFTKPHDERKTFLMCDDCGSTNLLLRVIVEADMVVDVNDSVVNMKDEHVQAVKVLGCGLCDSKNIIEFNVATETGMKKKNDWCLECEGDLECLKKLP